MRIHITALLLCCVTASATTFVADSAAWQDVSNALRQASSGDTVTIPAGTVQWDTTLRVTNAVTIVGAGSASTELRHTNGTLFTFVLSQAATNSGYPVRVSRIGFTNGTSLPSVHLYGQRGGDDAYGGGYSIRSFRVDHCSFLGGRRAVLAYGLCWGVVDSCTFSNCYTAIGHIADGNNAWLRQVGIGTTNCVVIEDSTFFCQPGYSWSTQVYNEQGARTAVRNCSFFGTTGDPSFLECHGNQNYYTGSGDYRGAVFVEAYRNTFSIGIENYRYLNFRGGSVLVWSNAFTDVNGETPMFRLDEEESWQAALFDPLKTEWPAQDQITNSFFWGNTLNGDAPETLISYTSTNAIPFIQEGRDYWLESPSESNGSPEGVYSAYTPLTYQHPLVRAQDGLIIRVHKITAGSVKLP